MIMYPYHITLPNAQGGAVPAVSPQKKSPQIGRLAAEKRMQFRIRARESAKSDQGRARIR